MGLIEMAKQFPDMSVTIRLGDLLEANQVLIERAKEEAEEQLASRERRIGCALVPKEDVLRLLGVNPSTLWRWEHEYDYLKPVRFGRKVYYRESDINAIIDAHTERQSHA